jgi:membrane-associated protein
VLNASIVSFLLHELQRLPGGLVYGLVALLVFGEAALFIGFVLPGETAVLIAGVVASQGRINIGAVVGDSVGYFIGHRYGERLFALPIIRHRREALERALDGLRKRGSTYVFVGRFTAFLRAVMPGLAGMSKMHYRRFLVANALGGITWGVSFTLLGYFAGGALVKIEKYAGWAGLAVLALVIAFVVTLHFVKKRRDSMRDAAWAASHPDNDDSAQRGQ